jgi:hypothetical protein
MDFGPPKYRIWTGFCCGAKSACALAAAGVFIPAVLGAPASLLTLAAIISAIAASDTVGQPDRFTIPEIVINPPRLMFHAFLGDACARNVPTRRCFPASVNGRCRW